LRPAIESALAPWRGRIVPAEWRRPCLRGGDGRGGEALIAQRDVCGLSTAEGEELSAWAARALVREALGNTRRRRAARASATKRD